MSEMSVVNDGPAVGPAFPDEAAAVLRRLRSKISTMFESLPGGVKKSRDVQKALGVDARLSWQIFRLAGPGDVMALAPHVPSATSMYRLIAAAKEYGISAGVLEGVREAFDEFERLVETHAGDRTSFDSMARGFYDDDKGGQGDLQHRKAIFKGNSHYYGMQVQTYVVTLMVHPGAVAGAYDFATLRGKLGRRRLRPDADVVVDAIRMTPPTGPDNFRCEVFDQEAMDKFHAPIIPRFCSRPLPQLRTIRADDGTSRTELVGDAIGRSSEVDMVFGQVWRNAPLTPSAANTRLSFNFQVRITVPVSLLIADVVVHQPSFPDLQFDFNVFAYGIPHDGNMQSPTLRLPFRERIAFVGSGADAALMRESPRYAELLAFACTTMGWRVEEMGIYRVRVEYPLLHSTPTLAFSTAANEIAAPHT